MQLTLDALPVEIRHAIYDLVMTEESQQHRLPRYNAPMAAAVRKRTHRPGSRRSPRRQQRSERLSSRKSSTWTDGRRDWRSRSTSIKPTTPANVPPGLASTLTQVSRLFRTEAMPKFYAHTAFVLAHPETARRWASVLPDTAIHHLRFLRLPAPAAVLAELGSTTNIADTICCCRMYGDVGWRDVDVWTGTVVAWRREADGRLVEVDVCESCRKGVRRFWDSLPAVASETRCLTKLALHQFISAALVDEDEYGRRDSTDLLLERQF